MFASRMLSCLDRLEFLLSSAPWKDVTACNGWFEVIQVRSSLAKKDFGQLFFATSDNFDFGQLLGVEFWDNKVWGPQRVGPKGWRPKPRNRRVGPRRVEPRRVGGPTFRSLFSLSRRKIRSFYLSLWVSSRGILVVFEAPGRSSVRVWMEFSGCRVRAPATRLVGPPGFHTTAREPKRAHLRVPE